LDRHILHIRLNKFFATVEQHRQPNLRDKPLIVTEPRGSGGVVISASKEAAKLGINEGDSVRQAQRICPDVMLFRSDHSTYRLVFGILLDILIQFTPLLEPDGLGSAYMDITASEALFGEPSQLCAKIISEVSARLDMPLTIGCAPNKLLAKIASGRGKWFVRVRPGNEAAFLDPLPVSSLEAVTGKIERRLSELGVTRIGELSRIGEPVMVRQFGPAGSVIHRQAAGVDFSPVKAGYPAEVIIAEHTFPCFLKEPVEVEAYIKPVAADLTGRLRKKNLLAGEIMLTLEGSQMQPACFKFKNPTCSSYSIAHALNRLLRSLMEAGTEVHKMRIELCGLTSGESFQLTLMGENKRASRLNRVIDILADRFGEGVVFAANALRSNHKSTVI
jgi:DNA polymerase-4